MRIINRYIGLSLMRSILLVLFVFIGLESFILLATQLSELGKGNYNVWQAILYVLLILPQQTYQLFSMAGLLGMLFGLSVLANNSELIILRAAGMSPHNIMYAAMRTAFIIVIFITILGEFVAPSARYLAEKRKVTATSAGHVLKTKQGLWLRQKHSFYYIKNIYSAHHIAEINRYVFNQNQQLQNISYGQEANYANDIWHVTNIKQTVFNPNGVTNISIPQENWNLALDPSLLVITQISSEEMSLYQLWRFIDYQNMSHLNSNLYQINFWQRVLQPIASLVMMFLAIPFIFGPLRTVTTSLRLVMGISTGFVFYLLNQLFPPMSQVLNFPPYLAVLLPIVLFATTGYLLLQRIY